MLLSKRLDALHHGMRSENRVRNLHDPCQNSGSSTSAHVPDTNSTEMKPWDHFHPNIRELFREPRMDGSRHQLHFSCQKIGSIVID
jgi:hypothetical protein